MTLISEINPSTSLNVRTLTKLITESNNQKLFFTNASVKAKGKVGRAIFCPSLAIKLLYRLPNKLSIYFAESFAILRAINLIINYNIEDTTIVSDCLQVLQDIKNLNLDRSPHPSIISDIFNLLQSSLQLNIKLKWMSAHTHSSAIIMTDLFAKEATKTHDITPINFSCDEAPLLVETWIWKKWAFNWTNNTKNCAYQTIFNTPIKYTHCHESRTKDTIVSRIRLQQTKLNGGLHKIGLHADGLCSTCKILENGYHLIMECTNTKELKKRIQDKLPNEDHFKYEFILNSPSIMDIVANYVIEQKINI